MTHRSILLFVFLAALSVSRAFAQDGSVPPDGSLSGSADPGNATDTIVSRPAEPVSPATSTAAMPDIAGEPKATASASASTSAPASAPALLTPIVTAPRMPEAEEAVPSDEPEMPFAALASILGVGGLAAGAYAIFRARKQKRPDDRNRTNRCFDIKKLMEEKLGELTDLRGQLQSGVEGRIGEAVQEAAEGTAAGDALALVRRAEEEYERLKKLYEQCIADLPSASRVVIVPDRPSLAAGAGDEAHGEPWLPWVSEELRGRGVRADVLSVPEPEESTYERLGKELEKYAIDEDTVLVGHGRGCDPLVRWLKERERRVRKLVLIAPQAMTGTDTMVRSLAEEVVLEDRDATEFPELLHEVS